MSLTILVNACGCGADLADALPQYTAIVGGEAMECRNCVRCLSTRSYRRIDALSETRVSLSGTRRVWPSLGVALNELIDDDERPTLPPGTMLLGFDMLPVAVAHEWYWRIIPFAKEHHEKE